MSAADQHLPDSLGSDQMPIDQKPFQQTRLIGDQPIQSLAPMLNQGILNNEQVGRGHDTSQSLLLFPIKTIKDKSEERVRKKCRCCPQTMKGRIICVSCILGFLVLLICLIYYYYPRLPEFKVLYVQVRPVNGDIPLNITQKSNNPTDISLQLPIFMGVSVVNPNRYDLTVDTFDLTAYIRPNITALKGSGLPGSLITNTLDAKVGYGAYGPRNFPSYYNTTFEIQVLLDYTPDPKFGLLNDPAFGDLLQVCGIKNNSENRTMTVKYDVGISMSFLAKLGINPVLPNEVSIKCPLTQPKINDLLNRFNAEGGDQKMKPNRSMLLRLGKRLRSGSSGSFKDDGYTRFQRNNNAPIFQKGLSESGSRVMGLLGLIGLGTFVYVRMNQDTVPITGRKRFMTIDKKTENYYGQMSSKMVLQQYDGQLLSSYHPTTQYVQKVAYNLLRANNLMNEADWKIYVVKNDSIVNAFVTPDGVIVVFTGIVKVAENEDGLATVLGHEIAHKFARHHAERLSQQNLTGFLRFLLSAFFDIPAVPSAIWMDLLLHKPNSRKHESEADRIGLEFMVNACYNPEEAVPLWRRMATLGGSGKIPELLSTHPSSESRIESFREWMPSARNKYEDNGCLRVSLE